MNFEFIGYTEDKNWNRVWGIVKIKNNGKISPTWFTPTGAVMFCTYILFYGAIGGKIKTRVWIDFSHAVGNKIKDKKRLYRPMTKEWLAAAIPDVMTTIEMAAIMAELQGDA